eukprot:9501158-Pyramimonas_sp.AAC.2
MVIARPPPAAERMDTFWRSAADQRDSAERCPQRTVPVRRPMRRLCSASVASDRARWGSYAPSGAERLSAR